MSRCSVTVGRTGDGTFAGLNFGPLNVGVWRVALALELGEAGRVPELAKNVEVAAIPSAGRQASFYGDVGCGLSSIRGRPTWLIPPGRLEIAAMLDAGGY
ncbi:MAG TPA: hypothetical protein VFO16_09515 [Pseudonocardiaceae bacterium]|nr:hypothetical protein [Pseudonocardiaceae bacterium]